MKKPEAKSRFIVYVDDYPDEEFDSLDKAVKHVENGADAECEVEIFKSVKKGRISTKVEWD